MQNLDETPPTEPGDETEQIPILPEDRTDLQPEEDKPRRQLGRLIGLGLLAVIILAALGSLGGYLTAIQDREQQAVAIVSTEIADQFLLGLIDFERGNFEVAMQRFEYILNIDPTNTAAAEKLTQTILKMNELNVLPTTEPTATPSPTPDARNQAELYNNVLAYRNQGDWTAVISALDTLRLQDPEYKAVELDGLYYMAYRNRGLQRIKQEGNLEGGIFDLNRAELFGLLDVDAINYREWASKYITGMSFWEVDWGQVVNYLSPLAISAPYLSDSTFFTAQDRLATAQVEVNLDVLSRARSRFVGGKYCDAYDLFNQAAAYIQLSAEDSSKFQLASDRCFGVPETAVPSETTSP